MAQTDREALVALYNATGGPNWSIKTSWDTDADLSEWHGVKTNEQGRVVELDLHQNNLQGHIPPQLGDLGALKYLNLSGNKLDGHIPKELGALSKLQRLEFWNNKLTGLIPEALGSLSELKELQLSWNKLKGFIPPELGNLRALKDLYLRNNQLSGAIPPELGDLRELRALSLSNNQLTGAIPPELGNLAALYTLELSGNQLSGPIPKELGALSKLKQLRLQLNGLTGSIPPELGNLKELTILWLYNNELTGQIPASIGLLRNLRVLDLQKNELSGPLPPELMNHKNFDDFATGLARDGPPLPEVDGGSHAIKILIVPVLLGYFDLGSDLYTAVSYYKSNHPMWGGLGLFFALGPAVIVSVFFLSRSKWYRRVLVATQLSLLWEAWVTVDAEEYSDILALVRVIEPLFESVPQLLLQLYALLFLWVDTSSSPSRLVWRVVSVCISATSLAYAATDVCSVERLLHNGEGDGVARSKVFPCCPSLTGLIFSRLPVQGSSPLNGLGNVHPRRHVWLCFVYHVLEIVGRFVSLSMIALVMRKWFFLVLPYLWGSRCLIVLMSALNAGDDVGCDTARKALEDFRFRVRLVAMPFLDSVLDGTIAYTAGLLVTLVEFTVCLAIFSFYRHDDLPSRVRLVLYVVAIGCMVGKMCLALVAIYPLQEGVGGRGAVVVDESVAGSGATATKEAKVEREVAPLEGGQQQPSTLATSTASGEVKVEDGLESV